MRPQQGWGRLGRSGPASRRAFGFVALAAIILRSFTRRDFFGHPQLGAGRSGILRRFFM